MLTLNVRRGDYYSNPHHRPEFAIDLAAYLRLAVASALAADGPVRRVHVVSDDPDVVSRTPVVARRTWRAR